MNLSNAEKSTIGSGLKRVGKPKWTDRLQDFWNERVMNRFIKANLFVICCIVAGILMLSYLIAFSCEVSWILEAKGELPVSAYILSVLFFIIFVASTILIHGLATRLPWGLFSWSVIIAILSIPELALVMIMTTQHWGLQSVHGLTELTTYLIRVVINCTTLLCVIPTALNWKRETKVLAQLQKLATRLQLQTPPPSGPLPINASRVGSKRARQRDGNSFDNPGFMVNEIAQNPPMDFFKNEFNASVFGGYLIPPPPQFAGPLIHPKTGIDSNAKKAQSLMDLRTTLPGVYNTRYVYGTDDIDAVETSSKLNTNIYNTLDDNKQNIDGMSMLGSCIDPIYCTIKPPKHKNSKSRQAISMENLAGVEQLQRDLNYDHNLLYNYQKQLHYWAMMGYPIVYPQQNTHGRRHRTISKFPFADEHYREPPNAIVGGVSYGGFTTPFVHSNINQNVGNEPEDYRKYRDVAL